jgi:A/G-specific adenine glycosylase
LRRGAGEVLERFGGQIPDNLTQLRSIAGIGEYTAGAILSIAFHARVPAVDGNVLRIISRLENIGDDIAKPAVKRQITALVADKVPHDRPGDFNQALMDLGASICIPRTPLCSQCPLSGDCRAYALGTERTLPLKAPKNKPEPVYVAAGVLRDATGRFLLRQRPQQGLLAGMWEFPGIERPDRHAHIQELQEFFTPAAESLVITENNRLDMTHTFSHRRWFIRFYFIEGDFSKIAVPDSKWIEPAACDQLPFAGPHRQAALHYCTNIG